MKSTEGTVRETLSYDELVDSIRAELAKTITENGGPGWDGIAMSTWHTPDNNYVVIVFPQTLDNVCLSYTQAKQIHKMIAKQLAKIEVEMDGVQ